MSTENYYTLSQLADKLLSVDLDEALVVALSKHHPELKITPVIIDGEKHWPKHLVEAWLKVVVPEYKSPTASKHCAIQEFLDLDVGLVVSLHTYRYGGGIIAMVCPAGKVEDYVDSIEDNNGEMEWELWGLRDSWYPIVEGDGISDALNRLRAKLLAEKADWDAIITGISILREFPYVHGKRVKCKTVSMSELHHLNAIWAQGESFDHLL